MALIFVTGARGAIGRHVVALARTRGNTVAGVGHGAWTGDDGLPTVDHWVNGTVDADNLVQLARLAGTPDAVVHLAGGALVGASISTPGEDFRRTVVASQRLLEWLRTDAPTARLVVASSAAVYGDGHPDPIVEGALVAPTSPYGTHKAMAEMLARCYARQFGTQVAIVRLFSVYGPGLRKQIVWDIATRLAAGERPISLSGSGRERRDFVFVSDAAAMLLDAVERAQSTAPTFNGCSGRGTEISTMADLIGTRFAGAKFDFSGRARTGDPYSLVGDPSQARRAGLSVTTDMEDGVAATVDWITSLPRTEPR